jgi:hypothetical protein
MRPAKSISLIIGILLLLQLAGLIVPFVLLLPLTKGPSEWLINAAGLSFQIKTAVFLLFANCALTIGISLAAFPVFRRHGHSLALLLVAASVVMFSLQAVDNSHLLSMVSLSEQYARAGSGQEALFQALAAAAGSTRRWVHYSELLVIDAWIFLLHAILYRFRLVPRLLAGFGALTVILHFTGITLPLYLGYSPVTVMGASMALGHLALAGWLMTKGFRERPAEDGIKRREEDE